MGQHGSQRSGRRNYALVFKQMNEPAQFAVVLGEGSGALEFRLKVATVDAPPIADK